MPFIRIFIQAFCVFVILFYSQKAFSIQWDIKKGEHFIVQFSENEDRQWVQKVLYKAEEYYRRITQQIGYSGFSTFWTWDKRVRIVIYPNREEFYKNTGQPVWAIGGIKRDDDVMKAKAIVSFKQEDKFIESVLPHEISHLVLHDYMGGGSQIPIWFDEGLAQLQEADKLRQADEFLRKYLIQNSAIPFGEFTGYDVRYETNPLKVSLFYIQSVSVVDFIIRKYGSSKFSRLCSYLKDGETFSAAFHKAYAGAVETLPELEKKWLRYMD